MRTSIRPAAVVFALACFAFAVVPGVLALVLGHRERLRVNSGRASLDALPYLRVARTLVWAQFAILLLLWVTRAR